MQASSGVNDRSAWLGSDLAKDQSWIVTFTPAELADLDTALRDVVRKKLPLEAVDRETFPLPTLAPRLAQVLTEIQQGRGFVLLRGLQVERYSDEEAGIIYWGVGSHLGTPVRQNVAGDLLGHIRDFGKKWGELGVRGYETNGHLIFHTDFSDMVGLLCLRPPKSGGASRIASSMTVYNELLRDHPEHIKVLHRAGKEGLSAAYLAGFRWGLDAGYDVLVEFDADGSHQPEELPKLLSALRRADMVKGSRWVPGGRVVNWPKSRELLSRGGSLYTRAMLGVPVKDITGGLNLFRRATLEAIIDDVQAGGYGIQRDLTWLAHRKGFRIVEVPITFHERTAGASKLGRDVFVEALRKTTEMGVKHRAGQARAGAAAAGGFALAVGRTAGRTVSDVVKRGQRTP